MICRRKMNLLQSIVIYCFLLHLLNRPLNDFPKSYPLPHPCQGAFPLRFLSAQNRRQRPPSSTSLQKLKIRWWQHRAGSTPAAGTKKRTPRRASSFCRRAFGARRSASLNSGERGIASSLALAPCRPCSLLSIPQMLRRYKAHFWSLPFGAAPSARFSSLIFYRSYAGF